MLQFGTIILRGHATWLLCIKQLIMHATAITFKLSVTGVMALDVCICLPVLHNIKHQFPGNGVYVGFVASNNSNKKGDE